MGDKSSAVCVNEILRGKLLCYFKILQVYCDWNKKKNGVGLKVEVKQEENIIHPAQLLLSQVFLLDLSLMPYYRHRVWVNTSAETSPHDKWTELNSACAQYHLWRVRHWVLLYRSHRKQVLRACPLQSFPQIFFSSFSPLHQLFSFHLAGLHQ